MDGSKRAGSAGDDDLDWAGVAAVAFAEDPATRRDLLQMLIDAEHVQIEAAIRSRNGAAIVASLNRLAAAGYPAAAEAVTRQFGARNLRRLADRIAAGGGSADPRRRPATDDGPGGAEQAISG